MKGNSSPEQTTGSDDFQPCPLPCIRKPVSHDCTAYYVHCSRSKPVEENERKILCAIMIPPPFLKQAAATKYSRSAEYQTRNWDKLATTTSSGGLFLPLLSGIVTACPEGAVSQALLLVRYKAVLLESSFRDSSACSFIYF